MHELRNVPGALLKPAKLFISDATAVIPLSPLAGFSVYFPRVPYGAGWGRGYLTIWLGWVAVALERAATGWRLPAIKVRSMLSLAAFSKKLATSRVIMGLSTYFGPTDFLVGKLIRRSLMAAQKPRTGDGPLELVRGGRSIILRMPIEGGGRLVLEVSNEEVEALKACLEDFS